MEHGHTHDHTDVRDHPHSSPTATTESTPLDRPVLLDIGGEVGAVIARLDDELEGTELPIQALDDPQWDPTTHTGVWRRSIGGGSVVVAVYPELHEGRYQITPPHAAARTFSVVGGHVTELDLRHHD